jgi:hypothetical protein
MREAKARLLRQQEELERDLREYERIAAKYGLGEATVPLAAAKGSQSAAKRLPNEPDPNSLTRRCQNGAEAIIRERGFPILTKEILEGLTKRGVKVTGKDPQKALSAFLSHSKNVYSIPGTGWWIRGEPLTDEHRKNGALRQAVERV